MHLSNHNVKIVSKVKVLNKKEYFIKSVKEKRNSQKYTKRLLNNNCIEKAEVIFFI